MRWETERSAHSATFPSLHLLHSSFSNPSFASPMSQALHLIHLASRPWFYTVHRCGTGDSMRACHAAGPGLISGRDRFPGWGFFRVFPSPVRQISGNFRPKDPRISFGRHNNYFIFALLEWMSVCMLCIAFHVCAVSEVAPALSWSLIRLGPPYSCVVK